MEQGETPRTHPGYIRAAARNRVIDYYRKSRNGREVPVANVVRHVPDRRCTLLLLRQASGVRVEVTDSSPQLPSTPAELLTDAESGRGLALTRWSTSGAWSQ